MMNNVQGFGINGTQDVQAKPVSIKDLPEKHLPEKSLQEKTAVEFETAFIAQMLQFSGLAKALTTGGGEAVESFTQFYIEELAKDISKNGGFGIADKISAYINAASLNTKEENHGELGNL